MKTTVTTYKICLAAGICLLSLITAYAQDAGIAADTVKTQKGTADTLKWNGDVSLSAKTNFDTDWTDIASSSAAKKFSNMAGDISASISGVSRVLKFNADISASGSYLVEDFYGLNGEESDISSLSKFDLKQSKTKKDEAVINAGLHYNPDRNNIFQFTVSAGRKDRETNSIIFGTTYKEGTSSSGKNENNTALRYTVDPKFTWTHTFIKPGRSMNLYAEWCLDNSDVVTTRDLLQDSEKTGLITSGVKTIPNYIENDVDLGWGWDEHHIFNVKGLDIKAALALHLVRNNDSYAVQTLSGKVWRDSTALSEEFDYLSIVAAPSLTVLYNSDKFRINWFISPEYFNSRLNYTGEKGDFNSGRTDLVVDLSNKWTPAKDNTIGLYFTRSVDRPKYIQLCEYYRFGTLTNELIIGNAKLQPTVKYRISADYSFSHNRFSTALAVGYEFTEGEMEKTYYIDMFNDVEFRIYTWVNSGYTHTTDAAVKLNWDGKTIAAHVDAVFKHFRGYAASEDMLTKSNDFKIKGDISCKLPWKSVFLARVRYQSKVTRVYGSMSDYVGCDVKLSRQFGRFNVFAEGDDLFDKKMYGTTKSTDGKEVRTEVMKNRRRVFRLGFHFKF